MGVLRSLGLALRAATRPGGPSMRERFAAVPRMARAALRGDYPALTKGRLLAMLGALLYVVSPVDVVPEGLFAVFGLADDAMLVTWLAGALINDTESFLTWERGVRATPQDAPRSFWQDGTTGYAAGAGAPPVQSYVVR
ncbi:MAG: DUF1232 domain-containing protein [Actinomycetales bacterium]|nr:DUF1232 domain-containing protein [Actinomycetales bacterium]